jgi:integrase
VQKVILHAPNQEARTLIALARFCGLRIPTDVMQLTWSDIDWDLGRIHVPKDSKTGYRVVPLFELARKELAILFEEAESGQPYIFMRARASAATTWRNWLLSAIASAKVEPWPKIYHNLRASLRSDLKTRFAASTLNAWFGHSTRVAEEHYEMVGNEDWEKAKEVYGG